MTEIPRLTIDNILFVFIDLQKKLLDNIPDSERIISCNILLIGAAATLGVPCMVTSQYRKGLGDLDESFASHAPAEVLDKVSFSCCGDDAFQSRLQAAGRQWVVVSGIETHICVLQTTLDLLKQHRVALVEDAVGARGLVDHQAGLKRMEAAGALPVTTEMLIYELLGRSDTSAFRRLLPMIRLKGSKAESSL